MAQKLCTWHPDLGPNDPYVVDCEAIEKEVRRLGVKNPEDYPVGSLLMIICTELTEENFYTFAERDKGLWTEGNNKEYLDRLRSVCREINRDG